MCKNKLTGAIVSLRWRILPPPPVLRIRIRKDLNRIRIYKAHIRKDPKLCSDLNLDPEQAKIR
jgi:hypothetical protein